MARLAFVGTTRSLRVSTFVESIESNMSQTYRGEFECLKRLAGTNIQLLKVLSVVRLSSGLAPLGFFTPSLFGERLRRIAGCAVLG